MIHHNSLYLSYKRFFHWCPACHVSMETCVEKLHSWLWKLKDILQLALKKAEDNIQPDTMITAVLWIRLLHLESRKSHQLCFKATQEKINHRCLECFNLGCFSTEQMPLERIHERCIILHSEAHLFEGQKFKNQQQHDRCQFLLTESFLKDLLWKKRPWLGCQEWNSVNMSAYIHTHLFYYLQLF